MVFSKGFSAQRKLKIIKTIIIQIKHSEENKLDIQIRHT